MREEESMRKELNEKIFNKDPIVRIVDPNYGQADYINKKYIMELKYRRDYGPERFNGSLIEKTKYDFITKSCGNKIPGYVCKFYDGSYYAWNLKKVKEPDWYEKMLPETTDFKSRRFVPKMVGDLYLEDGVKLI